MVLDKRRIFFELVNNGVITLKPQDEVIDEAFSIALKYGITVYDALYVAYANKNKAHLLTSDKRQAEVAKKMGISVVLIE